MPRNSVRSSHLSHQPPAPLRPILGLQAFWRFSRPYAAVGSVATVLSMYLIAWAMQPEPSTPPASALHLTPSALWTDLLLPVLAVFFAHLYIVGLNQVVDRDLDRVNHPTLPFAANQWSRRRVQGLVLSFGGLAVLVGAIAGPYLCATVGISLLLGALYSLPGIHLKMKAGWRIVCLVLLRGILLPIGVFWHVQDRPDMPSALWVFLGFSSLSAWAIAWVKDIPNTEGDRAFGVPTLALAVGPRNVLKVASLLWAVGYVWLMLMGLLKVYPTSLWFLVATHLSTLMLLWMRRSRIVWREKSAIVQAYHFLWKLLFLEYLLFPLSLLLAKG